VFGEVRMQSMDAQMTEAVVSVPPRLMAWLEMLERFGEEWDLHQEHALRDCLFFG
jgi:hypothetical protein